MPTTFDFTYLLFTIPGLILSLVAQGLLKKYYGTYSQIEAENRMTGIEAGSVIIQNENLDIKTERVAGELTDHYDSQNNVVRYSDGNTTSSIAGIAVVAHELGHACQDRDNAITLKIRNAIVPITNIGTNLGLILIMLGIGIQLTGLATVGLILFSFAFIFTLITLPIEFDASIRGIKMIEKYNLLNAGEMPGAKKVLTAAALTYVAAMASSLGQLAYYAMMVSGSNKRNDN